MYECLERMVWIFIVHPPPTPHTHSLESFLSWAGLLKALPTPTYIVSAHCFSVPLLTDVHSMYSVFFHNPLEGLLLGFLLRVLITELWNYFLNWSSGGIKNPFPKTSQMCLLLRCRALNGLECQLSKLCAIVALERIVFDFKMLSLHLISLYFTKHLMSRLHRYKWVQCQLQLTLATLTTKPLTSGRHFHSSTNA